MTWSEAVENYANYLRFEKNASENTIEAYVSDLQKLPFLMSICRSFFTKYQKSITAKGHRRGGFLPLKDFSVFCWKMNFVRTILPLF